MNEQTSQPLPDAIKRALMHGDLSGLTAEQQLLLFHQTCASLGLNPLTNPLQYVELPGGRGEKKRLVLYATKGCAEQLRKINSVSCVVKDTKIEEGIFIVTARAFDESGRFDEDIGAVGLEKENGKWKDNNNGRRFFDGDGTYSPLRGEERANALMRGVTKAKRRSTLGFCSLGMLDESEVESIPGAVIRADITTMARDSQTTAPHHEAKALDPSSPVEMSRKADATGSETTKKAELVEHIITRSQAIPNDRRREMMKRLFNATSTKELKALPYDELLLGDARLQEFLAHSPDPDDLDVADTFPSQVDVTMSQPPELPASAIDDDGLVVKEWIEVLPRRAKSLGEAAEEKWTQIEEESPAFTASDWAAHWVALGHASGLV